MKGMRECCVHGRIDCKSDYTHSGTLIQTDSTLTNISNRTNLVEVGLVARDQLVGDGLRRGDDVRVLGGAPRIFFKAGLVADQRARVERLYPVRALADAPPYIRGRLQQRLGADSGNSVRETKNID
jgi:hypothetical protein